MTETRSTWPSVRFVLASASPARLAHLQSAGVHPEVIVSGIDESSVTGTPASIALELAVRKATAVDAQINTQASNAQSNDPEASRPRLVLGCDSLLELDGQALGKPTSAAEAIDYWKQMRGHRGVLHTGHCLIWSAGSGEGEQSEWPRGLTPSDPQVCSQLASADVHFGSPTDAEIEAYVATGEPLRVAGGFTLDRLGGWFVDGISGDPGTVLGLSLPLLRQMLHEVGAVDDPLTVPTLWTHLGTPAP